MAFMSEINDDDDTCSMSRKNRMSVKNLSESLYCLSLQCVRTKFTYIYISDFLLKRMWSKYTSSKRQQECISVQGSCTGAAVADRPHPFRGPEKNNFERKTPTSSPLTRSPGSATGGQMSPMLISGRGKCLGSKSPTFDADAADSPLSRTAAAELHPSRFDQTAVRSVAPPICAIIINCRALGVGLDRQPATRQSFQFSDRRPIPSVTRLRRRCRGGEVRNVHDN